MTVLGFLPVFYFHLHIQTCVWWYQCRATSELLLEENIHMLKLKQKQNSPWTVAVVVLCVWLFLMILFAYFELCCVFVCGLFAVAGVGSGLLLQSGPQEHRPSSCPVELGSSVACGVFPDPRRSHPRLLRLLVDSSPLNHQGEPIGNYFISSLEKKKAELFQSSYHFCLCNDFFQMDSVRMEPFSLNQITSISCWVCTFGCSHRADEQWSYMMFLVESTEKIEIVLSCHLILFIFLATFWAGARLMMLVSIEKSSDCHTCLWEHFMIFGMI